MLHRAVTTSRNVLPVVFDAAGFGFIIWAAWTITPTLGAVTVGLVFLLTAWRVQT